MRLLKFLNLLWTLAALAASGCLAQPPAPEIRVEPPTVHVEPATVNVEPDPAVAELVAEIRAERSEREKAKATEAEKPKAQAVESGYTGAVMFGRKDCVYCGPLQKAIQAKLDQFSWRKDSFRFASYDGERSVPFIQYYIDGKLVDEVIGWDGDLNNIFERHPGSRRFGTRKPFSQARAVQVAAAAPLTSVVSVGPVYSAPSSRGYAVLAPPANRWTYPGDIYTHLLSHGYTSSQLAGMTRQQLEALHSATHEGKVVGRGIMRNPGVARAPPVVSFGFGMRATPRGFGFGVGACPGGVCP